MSRSTNWMFDGGPSAEWRSGTGNRTDSLLHNPIEAPSINLSSTIAPVASSINLPSTTLGGTTQTLKSVDPKIGTKIDWKAAAKDFVPSPLDKGSGGNPPPSLPPEGGLTSWFAKEGNMNMLGTAATGVNMLTGLAGLLSNLETANKQRKLLDQQLAHNKATMNNRKQLINQLKGSY